MSWEEVELFTVDNPGISAAELASRERDELVAALRAEGKVAGRKSRRTQGKPDQVTLELTWEGTE